MGDMPANEVLHSACDECRSRKLKCSRDVPKCVRCERERVDCVYSVRKPMGRPRKRRREGDEEDISDQPVEDMNGYETNLGSFSINPSLPESALASPPQLGSGGSSVNGTSLSTTEGHLEPTYDVGFPLSDVFGLNQMPGFDTGGDHSIDPALWDLSAPTPDDFSDPSQSSIGSCSCLSVMYLALSELHTVTDFHFPQVIIPLRKAMSTLSELIHCPYCPKEAFTATQNVTSIVALFKAILERVNKVICAIDAEALRLEQTGEKKPYRIGDNNPALHHLHTGTLDCPMGFNIELEAADWKRLVKAALKTEVYGGGSNPMPLMDLLKEADARQHKWHETAARMTPEQRKTFGAPVHMPALPVACESLGAAHLRRSAANLNWK